MSRFSTFALILILAQTSKGEVVEDQSSVVFFETKIRPTLVENCYECHSVESGKSKGSLLLDSRVSIRKGGSSGAAVVPGEVEKSLLISAMDHRDPDLEMPPRKDKLQKSVIDDFKKWIKMGAPDPREAIEGGTIVKAPITIEEGRKFWAFIKPERSAIPVVKEISWGKRELDRFVLAGLEGNKLAPSPDADAVIILRRLFFGVTGLPPTAEEVKGFLSKVENKGIDFAIASEVDRLLASDRFGERWGRHWLDVVRFAESSGKDSNLTFPHAWRYRDYTIDAVNADIPYDKFLTEQLAGDLLDSKSKQERARLLVATGFLAVGTKGLNEMNPEQFRADLIDEQIDTVTRAFMGQSVACARCHDHKFDAFSMKDYYALAGIFRSTKTFFGTWIDSENSVGGDLITLPRLENEVIPNLPIPVARLKEMKETLSQLAAEKKAGPKSLRDAIRIIWQMGGIEGKLKTIDTNGNALPLCMGTLDLSEPVDSPLYDRGEVSKPGKDVPREFPDVIQIGNSPKPSAKQSGRLELAKWLTHPDHPLTSRVMVNRIWKHLMGEGLVRSTDNFGFTGELPTHPELLDYLALKFQDNNWSFKWLIREIVLSRTYRQSSTWKEAAFLKDPENHFLWRIDKRRLEAEAIRDAMLSVSGQLDVSRRRGSLVAELKSQSVGLVRFNKSIPGDLDSSKYRSVYLPVMRDQLPDVLHLFDFAEPSLVTGRRDKTNVPVQALYLMNSSFVLQQSAALADRIESINSVSDRVNSAYQLCFSRPPNADELDLAINFLENHSGGKSLSALCQALLSTTEFRNLD